VLFPSVCLSHLLCTHAPARSFHLRQAAAERAAAAASGSQLAAAHAALHDRDADLSALEREFAAYRAQKGAEVAGLEARLQQLMQLAGLGAATAAPAGCSARSRGAPGGGGGNSAGVLQRRAAGQPSWRPAGAARPLVPGRVGTRRRGAPALGRGGLRRRCSLSESDSESEALNDPLLMGWPPLASPAPAGHASPPGVSAAAASARSSEALAAALRDCQFEAVLRQRAEVAAEALRGAASRLRAKLRAARQEARAARRAADAGAVAAAEAGAVREAAARLSEELAAAKEALRAAKAEGARQRQRSASAASAAAAAAAAAAANSGDLSAATMAAVAAAAADGCGAEALNGEAAAMLSVLSSQLTAERAGRAALDAKLRDAKASVDRKNALIR
jgi:hypothetical protein